MFVPVQYAHKMSCDWYTELETRSVSQSELARRIGVAPQTINRIVNGRRRGWPATRRAMAEALREFPPVFAAADREEAQPA